MTTNVDVLVYPSLLVLSLKEFPNNVTVNNLVHTKKKKNLQDKFLGMKLICIYIGDLRDFKTQPKFSSMLTTKENL